MPICIACNVRRELIEIERSTKTYEIFRYRCPVCKSILRLGRGPALRRATEKKCSACNGSGFKPVRLVPQPGRKIYPARCEKCGGKGRVRRAANQGGVPAP